MKYSQAVTSTAMVMVCVTPMECVNVSVHGQARHVKNDSVHLVLQLAKYQILQIQHIHSPFAVDEVIVMLVPVYVPVIQVLQDRAVDKCFVTTIAMVMENVSVWVLQLQHTMDIISIERLHIRDGMPTCFMDVNVTLVGEEQIVRNDNVIMVLIHDYPILVIIMNS